MPSAFEPGQYMDPETGLIYLRARYYDPATAQFLSRDPAVASTRGAYGYTGGDPLNASDPSGLFTIPGTNICIDIRDPNCRSIKEQHPKGSQQVANFAGGVLNGMTLGHGRGVIDGNPFTRGKINYCDHWFDYGTKAGYVVDAIAVLAAAAPYVAAAAPALAANPVVQAFAAGCAVGLGAYGVEYTASRLGALGDSPLKGSFESPLKHALPECLTVGAATATFFK